MPHENFTSEQQNIQPPMAHLLCERVGAVDYHDYWAEVEQVFSEEQNGEAVWISQDNRRDLTKLENVLLHPENVHLGKHTVPANKVAEEWYLKLGSFNTLRGADKMLTLGFVRLWEAARGVDEPSNDVDGAFRQSIMEILSTKDKDGVISEEIRDMVNDPERASQAILAGNVILDYVRTIPYDKRPKSTMAYLNLSRQLNEGLLRGLLEKKDLSHDQKRLASDAMKFKYEALFEAATTEWQTGANSEEQYQKKVNMVMHHQIGDLRKLAVNDKITNGDLYEHYFNVLLRYGMTGWRDENRYIIQSATRRQDEPHDLMVPFGERAMAFDATIVDLEAEMPRQFIQLKMPGAPHQDYVEGIRVFRGVLGGETPEESRREILTGLKQLQGLVGELYTEQSYIGETDVAEQHVQAVQRRLEHAKKNPI